jgi:uncharacterized membrane protein YbaN (DUF454 family)
VIPARAKVVALLTMSASMAWMLFAAEMPLPAKVAVGALLIGAATYVVSRPSRPADTPRAGAGDAATQAER